ncbi:hypothetical protein [Candidatus Hecatella orcuttiae]|uniref:hypothetical protein n=1 Tax=Candidatus Hecatella orcuttiae TaxID=1935119 RepID=UPI00286833D7|nr:hypothetical protein [Candidatus Hecatella orcuttiae]
MEDVKLRTGLGAVLWAVGVGLMAEKLLRYGALYTYPPHLLDHGLYGLILVALSLLLLSKQEKPVRGGALRRPEDGVTAAGG